MPDDIIRWICQINIIVGLPRRPLIFLTEILLMNLRAAYSTGCVLFPWMTCFLPSCTVEEFNTVSKFLYHAQSPSPILSTFCMSNYFIQLQFSLLNISYTLSTVTIPYLQLYWVPKMLFSNYCQRKLCKL